MEKVERELKGYVSGELKLNKVKLYIHARGDDYEKLLRKVHAIYNITKGGSIGKGLAKYRIDLLQSVSDAPLPVSPLALVELLRLNGYKVRVENGVIETDAGGETIREYYRKLSEIYTHLARIPSTAPTKRLIAVYAAYRNLTPQESIDILEDMGLIKVEGRKLVITHNFKEALKIALTARQD